MKKRYRPGLIVQLDVIIVVVIIVIGIYTFFSQEHLSRVERERSLQTYAGEIAQEAIVCIKEIPTYQWLLRYWYEHADTLSVEYDTDFSQNNATAVKCALFNRRYPRLQLQYALESEISALPERDQKLFAEIMYSWLLTRLNQLKQNFHTDFLYYMVTDVDGAEDPYGSQFYIMSAANPGEKRGTGYGEVYPCGYVIAVEEADLQTAMREAVLEVQAGDAPRTVPPPDLSGAYLDGYAFVDWVGDKAVLVGLSFSIKDLKREVAHMTRDGTSYAIFYEILLLQFLIAILFVIFIRPLKRISENVRTYAETKNSEAVRKDLTETITGAKAAAIRHNEIGQLADDFIALTGEIDEHVRRIEQMTAEKERIESELRLASAIQSNMVPSPSPDFLDRTEFDLYASMDPAREVGGDFYDYFLTDEDHLALVMADVSGKGVPAALFMVTAKTLIRNRAQTGETPAQILEHVNLQLCDGNELGFFVTVWLAILELSTGKGIAANAGHEHPALSRAGAPFELIKYKHDPVVGMLPALSFREHTFELHPGDRLFVYTDGVPEASNREEKMFGTDRMIEILNREGEVPLQDLLHSLRRSIDDFEDGADQFDDITMLCLQYKGKDV